MLAKQPKYSVWLPIKYCLDEVLEMKYYFNYKREAGLNPRCGIMSFQHFNGEKLYSDIEVLPENNMTETERVECYPISADAEENGRSEGYYPDSSIVYIRILWKEFEPERGVYNYAFIEDILRKARQSGQELMFRLMAHSTRACDDVPEWLKSLVDCPLRPDGMRVKDSPTDPLFIDLFLEAVKAFGERFDADPTLYAVDISLPGSWGEGHKLELYPENTMIRIADAYMEAFPTTQLMTQSIRPNIIEHVGRVRSIGWRGDGVGHPEHMEEKYPERLKLFPDNWKCGPVSCESYWWLCEWKRRGWDVDKIIETTLSWHISSFNPKSMPIPYEWQDKIEDWIAKMGYHFTIRSAEIPDEIRSGDEIKIEIENVGVAPIYENIPFVIRLEGEGECYETRADCDVTEWLPGGHTVTVRLVLPSSYKRGSYELSAGIYSPERPRIYLATDAEPRGNLYKIANVKIV